MSEKGDSPPFFYYNIFSYYIDRWLNNMTVEIVWTA